MQPIFVALLLVAGTSFAEELADPCAQCEYNNGVGYLPSKGCRRFLQCLLIEEDGYYLSQEFCCPNHTKWDQEHLQCIIGYCDDDFYGCPGLNATNSTCLYEAYEGDYSRFVSTETGDVFSCAPGTIFDEYNCSCVHGGKETCRKDPLIHFPFGKDFVDIQCHKVPAIPFGDIEIEADGCVRFNGIDEYLSFHFLNNYFAWRDVDCLSISFWFKQAQDGWDNVNNYPVEGILGNGNCKTEGSSLWMGFGETFQQAGVRTTGGNSAVFSADDADADDRFYLEPEIWCQYGLVFSGDEVSIYLNGNKTGTRPVVGDYINTQSPWSLGLAYLEDCEAFFYTGCIDEVMVFDRCVSDPEMYELFSLFPQQPLGFEFPYISNFI